MRLIAIAFVLGAFLTSCQSVQLEIPEPPQTATAGSPTTSPTPTPGFRQGTSHPLPTGLIIEGKSVGPLQLGASRDAAISALGETLDEFNIDVTEMHWMNWEDDDNGIFAYLRDDKVFEIDCDSKNFKLSNGFKVENDPILLKRLYPNLKAYRLLHSGAKVNGGEDLVYWIDETKGIAFTIYYYKNQGKKLVGTIIVFEPGTGFTPRKFSPPRKWVKIPDWTY